MENQKNDNLNLLEAVVQNTEMGKNTLEQIVPMTDDVQFKAELLRQRNVYHQLNQEAHTAIEACGGTAQGQSTMAKLNTKMGIGIKTLTDKSTRCWPARQWHRRSRRRHADGTASHDRQCSRLWCTCRRPSPRGSA